MKEQGKISSENADSSGTNGFLAAKLSTFDQDTHQLKSPSTESQREIWTSAMMSMEGSLAFNESIYLRFKGPLNVIILKQSIQKLVDRHESLRATFSSDGKTFCVANHFVIQVPFVDFSSSVERDVELKSLLVREVENPFDLEQGPLFRAQIVKMGESDHVLVLSAHHIICDGWSYFIILKDLAYFYTSALQGETAQLESPNLYRNYATQMKDRLRTPEYLADENYWLESFKTFPPPLELPIDKPRPLFRTYSSKREDFILDSSLISMIKKTGAKLGCSFVQTFLGSFLALLNRLSGQEDIVIGILAAGQAISNQQNLVGHCVNTLPLRNFISKDFQFDIFLKGLKKTMLDAYEHQQFTYGTLLQHLNIVRDPSRIPLCSVLFNIDQSLDANKLGFKDLNVVFASNPRRYENFELFINVVDNSGSIILEVQYNTDLFNASSIRHFFSCFEILLKSIVAEPHKKISHLQLLSYQEQEKILVHWNATQTEYPPLATVHQLFSQQAQKTPDQLAVQFENHKGISYRELDERSNQLACYLIGKGVNEGTLVGLCVNRSVEMIIATLGVMKSGGAYVPLDPAYPKDRLGHMIHNSKLSIIVCQSWLIDQLPEHDAQIVSLDIEATSISEMSIAPLDFSLNPESPVYVIYTSGSTGKPKGVMVPHRGVVNFLTSMSRKPGITSKDILIAVTTLSFDIAVLELYLPLINGAQTVIASTETASDGIELLNLLKNSKATMMQATPSTWRLLISSGWDNSKILGVNFKALCGGEALSQHLASQILERVGSLWNMYGPTETTVWSSCTRIESAKKTITIGKPIDNTQFYVFDNLLQPVPIGVPGELYIGGAGVTLGYLHRSDLTAERFIENPYFDPFAETISPRLYKTGDLVRYLENGNIEYIGRNDNQVKVRGYRIELGEIETVLEQHNAVQQSVVIIREDNPGDVRIVAYGIPKSGVVLDFKEIREYLRAYLPEYMIPQHLVPMDHFPQTQNGKIDRKALPIPDDTAGHNQENNSDLPETETEHLIARIWRELLRVEHIGLNDNFFNLGGHSLLSTQFIQQLFQETGFKLNPRLVLLNTLAQLAQEVEKNKANNNALSSQQTEIVKPNQGLINRIRNRLFFKKGDATNISSKINGSEILKRNSTSGYAIASLIQERFWKIDKVYPGETAYNLPAAFRIKGTLNAVALEKSINKFINRHPILRTTFVQNQNGTLEQKVNPEFQFNLTQIDLSDMLENQEIKLLEILSNEAAKSFDLSKGPLIRSLLYKLNNQENVLFFMPHHAVWDGWSFDIFLSELGTLYNDFSKNNSPQLQDLQLDYGDFSVWQREYAASDKLLHEKNYWLNQLSGILPILKLPQQKNIKEKTSFAGAMCTLTYPKALTDSLSNIAHHEGATLSIILLTAFNVFLYSYSENKDILVGLPVLGREQASVQNMIGCFVNTLLIRTLIDSEETTFLQLLNQVQTKIFEIYQHQNMPFDQLVHELKENGQIQKDYKIQTLFSFQDATQRNTHFGDLTLDQILLHPKGVPYDLMLWFKFNNQGLNGAIEYSTDLFDEFAILEMKKNFSSLLEIIKENPDITLKKLRLQLNNNIQSIKPDVISNKFSPVQITSSVNPFYFDSAGKQIFGIYHPTKAKVIAKKAILLCYPVGHEYTRSHWVFTQLTSQLVQAGFPVLRFEYYATGDSQGETSEATLTQWKTDVVSATKKLQSLSGINKISIVGLRLGALIATLAVEEGLDVENLILWDPVVKVSNYIKELKLLHKKLLQTFTVKKRSMNRIHFNHEMLGFNYSSVLINEIANIDLTQINCFKSKKTVIITTSTSEKELADLKTLKSDMNLFQIDDGGYWNDLAESYGRLICPMVIQSILEKLSGRSS